MAVQQQYVGEVSKSIAQLFRCKLTQYNVCQISEKLVIIYRNYSEMRKGDSFLDHSVYVIT